MQVKLALGLAMAMFLAGNPALGADAPRPDPLLQGAMPGPCMAALEGADYVPGLDADGQPVARADIGAERVPVPGDLWVPLPNSTPQGRGGRGGRGGGQQPSEPIFMMLGRDRVDRLVNPQACPPEPARN